jgi:hypothetical protein
MLKPARVSKGILPLNMHRDGFFVTGETWSEFNATFPSITFSEFWSIKLCLYEIHNTTTKMFFVVFQRDPACHARILANCALWHEIRRVQNSSNVRYTPPEGLEEPKSEPVDNDCGALEFMYRVPI